MKSSFQRLTLTRRRFVQGAGSAVAVATIGYPGIIAARDHELVINKILVQEVKGRRLAPLGPNAQRKGSGPPKPRMDEVEVILRIQTAQGLEGICCMPWQASAESLNKLIGLDPFKLFQFDANDRILAPAERYHSLFAELKGGDVALIDLMGRALKRPAAALLGTPARDAVPAYDSTLYMDELLPKESLKDLPYIKGALPSDPVELLARKAQWVVQTRPEGFRAIKIKIGRMKWMRTLEEALTRDIAITNAIRQAVGSEVKLFVDANRSYWGMPEVAWSYAQDVAESKIVFMEEMFPEEDVGNMIEFKRRLRSIGVVKLAAGESSLGGIAEEIFTRRLADESLIDVEQADMNYHGFLYLRAKATRQEKLGITMAPHNFASKIGFYAQVHLGMVTPNWEISEMDDTQYPAMVAEGIEVKNGHAKLTGAPGLGVSLREEYLQKAKLVI